MDKVPLAHTFLDFSDYARPAGRWLAEKLVPTPITPIHLTLAFTVVGFAAAILLAWDRWLWAAGALLLVKSGLDAADGSLARARARPSRVGRFLDSVCDFLVMAAVFAGIALGAWSQTGSWATAWLALSALFSATWQGSTYSYYFVRYRAQVSGDQTSHVHEAQAEPYPWDHPAAARGLHFLYRVIYAWQDRALHRLDQWVAAPSAGLTPAFLIATSLLGLGSQLMVLAVCAAVGYPALALWLFVTVFNLYWLTLIAGRFRHARRYLQAL